MNIIYDISIYEIAIIVISAIGGFFALFQWKQSYKLERAKLIKEASSKIRDDEEIATALYAIEYWEKWYPFKDDHNDEQKFDRVFSFFNYLCYLKSKHILRKDEFRIFEYKIQRMAKDASTINYLHFIYHFAKRNNTDVSFYHLLLYMKSNNLLSDDFWI